MIWLVRKAIPKMYERWSRVARERSKRDKMGIVPMGGVLVSARIENLEDVYDAKKGRLRNDQIRSLELDDALVDTGATML